MIELEVQCGRCKKKQRYISYNVKDRTQVDGKKKRCVVCGAIIDVRKHMVREIRT